MKVSLLMLKDFELGGELHKAGEIIEVDQKVADVLVEQKIAEPKTIEQHIQEQTRRAEEARKAQEAKATAEARQSLDTAVVTKVRDRIADDPKGGYLCLSEFALDVARASRPGVRPSEKLTRWDGYCRTAGAQQFKLPNQKAIMVEYDDEQGGFLVPTEFRANLFQIALENSIVRGRAQFVPMATNRIAFPAINDTSHASSFFGGVRVYRPGEADWKHSSKPEFAQVALTLHKLVVMSHVSDELLEDSPISIEPLLTTMMGSAIGFTEDEDFINGTGVNMALGAANAGNPSLIQVARQLAGQVNYQDIVRMWSRLWPAARSRAIWMCNADVLPQLMQMTFPGGATPYPVFMPAGGVSATPYATIMGRPLIDTEKCQTLGVMGDIFLVDWSQYLIGGKGAAGAPRIDSSIHLYFDYDLTAFRAVLRYDGQPWWLSDITPRHGNNTFSPFVVLSDANILTTTTTDTTTTVTTTTEVTTTGIQTPGQTTITTEG